MSRNYNNIKTSARKINVAVRRTEALKLRRQGLSYKAIGEKMGINPQTAHQYVKKALELILEDQKEQAEHVLQLSRDRLDALLEAHFEKATDKHDPESAKLVLSILDRIHKLYGLDAPQKVKMEVTEGSEEDLLRQARMVGLDMSQDSTASPPPSEGEKEEQNERDSRTQAHGLPDLQEGAGAGSDGPALLRLPGAD